MSISLYTYIRTPAVGAAAVAATGGAAGLPATAPANGADAGTPIVCARPLV